MLPLKELEFKLKTGAEITEECKTSILENNRTSGSLFREAAQEGFLHVVNFFLEVKDPYPGLQGEQWKCSNEKASDHSGTTPLHLAAASGHTAIVKRLLLFGALMDITNVRNETPLFVAARGGHESVVRLLVMHGAGVNHFSRRHNRSVIEAAASEGHAAIVDYLLSSGAHEREALYFAVDGGHIGVVRVLIQHEADASCEHQGRRALHRAAEKGHLSMCELLLDAGVHVDELDVWERTALHWAVDQGHLPIVQLLLLRNAPVNAQSFLSEAPLYIAVRKGHMSIALLLCSYGAVLDKKRCLKDAVDRGLFLAVLSLAAMGTDLNVMGSSTPLHDACEKNHPLIVRCFLERGVSVNAQDTVGNTPLHLASSNDEGEDVVKLLLAHGASPDPVNKYRQTPLLVAESFPVQSALLSNGADPNVTDDGGCTLLHKATSVELIRELLLREVLVDARDTNVRTPLHYACIRGLKDIAELLIEHGASVNTRDLKGESPLSISLKLLYYNVVKLLLENDVYIEMRYKMDQSALHIAALHGGIGTIHLLVEHGAKVDVRDEDSNTPLHLAAAIGNIDEARALVRLGANVNTKNAVGSTPLHGTNSAELAEFLLENGADLTLCDAGGNTALDKAKAACWEQVASVLENYSVGRLIKQLSQIRTRRMRF